MALAGSTFAARSAGTQLARAEFSESPNGNAPENQVSCADALGCGTTIGTRSEGPYQGIKHGLSRKF